MVLERSRTGVIPTQESMPDATAAGPSPEPAPDPSGSVSVALAQFYPRLGDVAANIAAHLTVIATARRLCAGLVVFPELSLTGYFLKDQVPEVALRIDAPEIHALQDASRDGDIDIVAGLILESDGAPLLQRVPLHQWRRGGARPPQGLPPTYGLFDEQRYLAAGDRFRAFDAPLGNRTEHRWRAGILICEDLWHPTSAGLLARQGVDLIICPSASPGRGLLQGDAVGTATAMTS